MKKTFVGLALCFVVVLSSCKKSDGNDTVAVTKENIAGTYKWSTITAKVGSAAEVDFKSSLLQPCEYDDEITFKTDLTYSYKDAGTVCSPNGNDTGAWSLPSSSSMIWDGETYTVESLTSSKLVLTQTETVSGITTLYRVTLTK